MNNIGETNGKKYKAGPWQIWNGGENPVPGKVVQCQIRRESRQEAEKNPIISKSERLRWSDMNSAYDIVCFRVMEEVKPEVVEVVRWIDRISRSESGLCLFACRGSGSNIVGKITFNLVDGIPDPKSIKMELI